jgi:hypothetical protein
VIFIAASTFSISLAMRDRSWRGADAAEVARVLSGDGEPQLLGSLGEPLQPALKLFIIWSFLLDNS